MTDLAKSNIDFNETFLHLSKAPITEAIIEFRGRASLPWEEKDILTKLQNELPDYPQHQSGRAQQFRVIPQNEQKVEIQDIGWLGLKFTSNDKKSIATFNIDSFSSSRLEPYQNWDSFINVTKRLWNLHLKFANPPEIQRMGVRFINRFSLTSTHTQLDQYFNGSCNLVPGLNLGINGFLHHDVYSYLGLPYLVNVIRTIQPSGSQLESNLILDIDVFTQNPFSPTNESIEQKLFQIHWLKNKIFFSIITQRLADQLK
ncbi:MAG: TIGR04255 family protein [Bacteroidota bacterium]